MKTGSLLLLSLTLLILQSCDPMRRIRMTNKSGSEASITWVIKEDSIHQSPFFISSTKKQKFVLPADARPIRLSAGMGTWTKRELRNVVNDLDSVLIEWNNGSIRLGSEEDIMSFLMTRRRGLGKDKIDIVIKNHE